MSSVPWNRATGSNGVHCRYDFATGGGVHVSFPATGGETCLGDKRSRIEWCNVPATRRRARDHHWLSSRAGSKVCDGPMGNVSAGDMHQGVGDWCGRKLLNWR